MLSQTTIILISVLVCVLGSLKMAISDVEIPKSDAWNQRKV